MTDWKWSRDCRETSVPKTPKTCGKWSKPSQGTKAEVPTSYVRPRYQMILTYFMLTLISWTKSQLPPEDEPMSIPTAVLGGILLRVKMSKAAGLEGITGHALKTQAEWMSLLTSLTYNCHRKSVPIYFKTTTIIIHNENNTSNNTISHMKLMGK